MELVGNDAELSLIDLIGQIAEPVVLPALGFLSPRIELDDNRAVRLVGLNGPGDRVDAHRLRVVVNDNTKGIGGGHG
jgi:hypothetical protein